jgi:nitroreductase
MLKPESLVELLEWRYAAKSFAAQEIPPGTWAALEKALVLTPSSYGLQPWKFLVVRDAAQRKLLQAASWNQRQVSECSHYVVFAHRVIMDEAYVDHYMATMAAIRGIPVESLVGFRKAILGDVVNGPRSKVIREWTARQCYIALGNFMTAAAALGVDTCPMEGLDPEKYDEILGLDRDQFRTVMACAAGYRHPDDKLALAKKVRFGLDEMVERI